MSDEAQIAAITKTFEEGDLTFTEDQHRSIIKERIQKDKASGSKFARWLRGVLHWGDPEPFAPEPISDEEMVRLGRECEQESLRLLADPGWKKEKDGVLPGDLVEVLQHPKYGKIFKLTGVVDIPAEYLYKEMTDGLEQMSSWNPTILECRLLKNVDAYTSLTYQVTTGGPKNAVKPRDFVCVRRCSRVQGLLLSSAISVEHPDQPPHHQYIRGHNHVGCWSIEVVSERSTRFQWLMACDLKGWLPQYVLDIAFSTAQLDFLAHLRKYAAKKQAEGAF